MSIQTAIELDEVKTAWGRLKGAINTENVIISEIKSVLQVLLSSEAFISSASEEEIEFVNQQALRLNIR